MAEVLLFHHVQGLTDGVRAFADDLRAGGHTVHAPDLFDGQTFGSIQDGFSYVKSLDEGTIDQRVAAAVEGLPEALVYAGISYGVPPALQLAVTRPGAQASGDARVRHAHRGRVGRRPVPRGPAAADPRRRGRRVLPGGQGVRRPGRRAPRRSGRSVFVYPTQQHLFTDRSLPAYDADSAALVTQRILGLLDRV